MKCLLDKIITLKGVSPMEFRMVLKGILLYAVGTSGGGSRSVL